MDPKEWQRLADEVASEVGQALDEIETEFWPEPSDPSFRSFWPRIRVLSDRLRNAPAIDIENKLQLLGRVRQITKRAREDQEVFFTEQRHRKQELLDRIEELRTQALDSRNPEQVRGLRQELTAMSDTVASVPLPTRGDRQEVRDTWRTATKAVWDHLSELWKANEAQLTPLLDQAKNRLDRGNVREAREFVRQFNTLVRTLEVSHKASRNLRARANEIWRSAEEVAKTKHESFVASAPEKVERWRHVQGRNAHAINRLRVEIGELEANENAGGLAAAFARAMIGDKLHELERLEATNGSLEDRIESAESALTSVG